MIQHLCAITFFVRNMEEALAFYAKIGFQLLYGGSQAAFSSLRIGNAFVNLSYSTDYTPTHWGRAIFRVEDVDELYDAITAQGLTPSTTPQDASWGERYFHLTDPNGNELSFAKLL